MANSVLAKMAIIISANTAELLRATQQGSRSLVSLSKTAESAGKLIGYYFGVTTIFRGVRYGVGVLANFEQKMQEVRAVTGSTGEEFAQLQANATKLGAATEYTATQIAGLQAEFGRLGFRTKEILDSTKATVNLATATGSDLASSAKIAGSTLRAFQLDAKEMGRVTDVMSASFNKSALQLDSFAESMKYVAPIAKAAGVSIEETTGYLSVLADSGIRGSQAGTALRRIFAELTDDGRPLSARLDELAAKGLTLADANDEVGRYAQTALLVLSSQTGKIKELTGTYQDAAGEARRTAETMRDTLSNSFKLLGSAIDGAIQKGTWFGRVLRKMVEGTTDVITVASGGDIQVLPEDELKFFIRTFEVGNKFADYFKEKLIELAKTGDIVFTDTAINQYIERFNVAASKAEDLRRALREIQQDAQKRINNQGTDIDSLTGAPIGPGAEDAFELGKKHIEERKQAEAKAALELKNAQDEINKKYQERLNLLRVIRAEYEAGVETEKELAKTIVGLGGALSQKNTFSANLPDKVTPGKGSPFGNIQIIPDGLIEESEERLKEMESIADRIEAINERISNSYIELGVAILEAAGTALGGGGDFGKQLLKTIANFGKQYGAQLVALGVAKVAEGVAFDNPDAVRKGAGLIAAGGALVFASSALASSISGQSSGSSSSSNTTFDRNRVGNTQNSIKIEVSGKLVGEGQSLVAVINSAQQSNYQLKG